MGENIKYKMIYTMPSNFEERVTKAVSEFIVKRQTISPKWSGDPTQHPYAPFIYKYNVVNVYQYYVTKVYREFSPDLFSLRLWYVDFTNFDLNEHYFKKGDNEWLNPDDAADVVFGIFVDVFREYFYGGGGWAPTNDKAAAEAVLVSDSKGSSAYGNRPFYLPPNFIPARTNVNGDPNYPTPPINPADVCDLPPPVKQEPKPTPKPAVTRNAAKPVPKPVAKPTVTRNQAKPVPKPVPKPVTRRR